MLGRVDEQPADVRMRAQRRDELGVAVVDLLEGEPAVELHEIDEPEVAGAEHDDVAIGDVVLRALLLLRAGRLADGVLDHRALLVAAGVAGHLPAGE